MVLALETADCLQKYGARDSVGAFLSIAGERGGAKEVGAMTSLSTIYIAVGVVCIDAFWIILCIELTVSQLLYENLLLMDL